MLLYFSFCMFVSADGNPITKALSQISSSVKLLNANNNSIFCLKQTNKDELVVGWNNSSPTVALQNTEWFIRMAAKDNILSLNIEKKFNLEYTISDQYVPSGRHTVILCFYPTEVIVTYNHSGVIISNTSIPIFVGAEPLFGNVTITNAELIGIAFKISSGHTEYGQLCLEEQGEVNAAVIKTWNKKGYRLASLRKPRKSIYDDTSTTPQSTVNKATPDNGATRDSRITYWGIFGVCIGALITLSIISTIVAVTMIYWLWKQYNVQQWLISLCSSNTEEPMEDVNDSSSLKSPDEKTPLC